MHYLTPILKKLKSRYPDLKVYEIDNRSHVLGLHFQTGAKRIKKEFFTELNRLLRHKSEKFVEVHVSKEAPKEGKKII
jgi:hypothetical protein